LLSRLSARREARVLEEAFGDSYREYRRKTWFEGVILSNDARTAFALAAVNVISRNEKILWLLMLLLGAAGVLGAITQASVVPPPCQQCRRQFEEWARTSR
jgi:hypothetical protein